MWRTRMTLAMLAAGAVPGALGAQGRPGVASAAVSTVRFVVPPHRLPSRLTTTVYALPAARSVRAGASIASAYDPALDRTEIALRPVRLDARTTLRASYSHAGARASHLPFVVALTIGRTAGARPAADSLVIRLDAGERLAVPLSGAECGPRTPARDEPTGCLPLADFVRLLEARTIRVELGAESWPLSRSVLADLRALASRMTY